MSLTIFFLAHKWVDNRLGTAYSQRDLKLCVQGLLISPAQSLTREG